MSSRAVSCRVVSYRDVSCCVVLSCRVMSYNVVSCTVMSCHVISERVMSCHDMRIVMSHRGAANPVRSRHVCSICAYSPMYVGCVGPSLNAPGGVGGQVAGGRGASLHVDHTLRHHLHRADEGLGFHLRVLWAALRV